MDGNRTAESLYPLFASVSISELEDVLAKTENREEKLLCRALINLKLQLLQEKVVGEMLL